MLAFDSAAVEEWDYLDIDVLKPARSSRVCMTCQHFRFEVGTHCVTVLACPIHQGLIPPGEHLTRRCTGWVPWWEVARGVVLRWRDWEVSPQNFNPAASAKTAQGTWHQEHVAHPDADEE